MLERQTWSRPIVPGSPGVEFGPDGVTPTAVKIWGPGENESTKGSVFFTARSAMLIMQAFKDRGMPLMWDYDHESTIPPEERKAAASSGFGCASATFSTLELRGADGVSVDGFDQELWSARIQWTDTARKQILNGDRRQVSPWFATEKGTGEIVELYNMALCTEGATNRGRILSPLQMRLFNRGTRMEEIIAALKAAIEAGDWEQVKAALDALQSLTPAPGVDMAAIKAAVNDATQEAVNTALKRYGRTPTPSGETEAVRHAREAGEQAALEVRRERVMASIERAGEDILSAESVKVLHTRGDVEITKLVLAEVWRHQKRRDARGGDAPPGGGSGADVVTLSEADKRIAAANGVDPKKMAEARKRMELGRLAGGRKGG